jgi:hypothetical protein
MGIVARFTAPTPNFFKILRNIGLGLAATGGTLIATPIALPAIVVLIGKYLLLAGTVASTVAQSAVENE